MELDAGKPRPSARGGTPAQQREHLARGRDTIRRLIDAGTEIFGREGYRGASIGAIVERAGISRATFYLYFANKDDLFRALTQDAVEEMSALADSLASVPVDADGVPQLRSWVVQYLDVCGRMAPVTQAWAEAFATEHKFGVLGAETLERFTGALTHQLEALGTPTPRVTALALVGMLDRFSAYVRYGRIARSREELLDALAGVVQRMVAPLPIGVTPCADTTDLSD